MKTKLIIITYLLTLLLLIPTSHEPIVKTQIISSTLQISPRTLTWQFTQGKTQKQTITITNPTNKTLTLHINLTNWRPETAKHYTFIYWNLENQTIQPKQTKTANITFYIYPLITKYPLSTFTVTINITENANGRP